MNGVFVSMGYFAIGGVSPQWGRTSCLGPRMVYPDWFFHTKCQSPPPEMEEAVSHIKMLIRRMKAEEFLIEPRRRSSFGSELWNKILSGSDQPSNEKEEADKMIESKAWPLRNTRAWCLTWYFPNNVIIQTFINALVKKICALEVDRSRGLFIGTQESSIARSGSSFSNWQKLERVM